MSLHCIFFNEQDKGLNTLREGEPQTTAPASSPADTEQTSATTNPSSRKREQKSQQKSSRLASPTSPTSSVGTAIDMLGGAFGDDANEDAQARRRREEEEEKARNEREERDRSQQQLLDEQRREREQREASEAAERAAAAAARPSTTAEEEAARQREEEERRRKQAKEWGDSHHDARGQPASPSKPDNQHRLGAEHDEVSVQSINHYDIVYGIGDDASGSGGAVPRDLDSWATWDDDDDTKGGGVGGRGGEGGSTPGSGGCHGAEGGIALMDEGVTFFRYKKPLAVRLRQKQEKEMRRTKQGGRWRRLRNLRSQEPAADDRSLVRIDLMLLSVPSHVLHTIRVYDHTVVGRRSEYLKSVQVFSKGPRSNFEDGPGGAADGVAAGEVAGAATREAEGARSRSRGAGFSAKEAHLQAAHHVSLDTIVDSTTVEVFSMSAGSPDTPKATAASKGALRRHHKLELAAAREHCHTGGNAVDCMHLTQRQWDHFLLQSRNMAAYVRDMATTTETSVDDGAGGSFVASAIIYTNGIEDDRESSLIRYEAYGLIRHTSTVVDGSEEVEGSLLPTRHNKHKH